MSNRDLLKQFVDGTPLDNAQLDALRSDGWIARDGTRWRVTTAGAILLGPPPLPPGDSASCPDTDSYFPPPLTNERLVRHEERMAKVRAERTVKPGRSEGDALDVQIGGDHYKTLKIQPVEFIEANGIPFLEGCVIKRMCRHGSKAKAEDLRKAIHEIKLLLELRYGEKP